MDNLKCLVCKEEYEDCLVLGCTHSLCLSCAKNVMIRDEKYYDNKYIKCDLCQKLTSIDESTMKEIYEYVSTEILLKNETNKVLNFHYNQSNYTNNENLTQEYQNRHTINSNNVVHLNNEDAFSNSKLNNSINNNNKVSYSVQNSNLNSNNKYNINNDLKNSNNFLLQTQSRNNVVDNRLDSSSFFNNVKLLGTNTVKTLCQQHNEETTYFCFTCYKKCICSECIIHGDHKNHEVLNYKQAYPIIIEETNELMNNISDKILEIKTVQSSIEKSRVEMIAFTDKIKEETVQAFNELRARLDAKEKELLSRSEKFLEDSLQEFNTYSRIIQSKVISLSKVIDNVNSQLMRKEEIHYLNYFSENKTKLSNLIETEFIDFPDLNSFRSVKVNIDNSSLKAMINSLGGLHLEINMIKGFDVAKKLRDRKNFVENISLQYGQYGGSSLYNGIKNNNSNLNKENFSRSISREYIKNKTYSNENINKADNLNISIHSNNFNNMNNNNNMTKVNSISGQDFIKSLKGMSKNTNFEENQNS